MNKLLPFLFLLAGLSGCGSGGAGAGVDPIPAPSDPFLGKWQADNFRSTVYDASGKVISDSDDKQVTKLEVSPTTMTFTGVTRGGTPTTSIEAYTRSGELIIYTGPNATTKETVYARDLTSTSFKLEFNQQKVAGKTYYIQSFSFHR